MHASPIERKKTRATEGRDGNANDGNQVHQNIGDTERMVSSILGGTMLLSGLTRRTLPGLALAAAGAAFLYRGGSGHCMVYESMGLDTHRAPLNADRSSGPPHKAPRREGSIEETQAPLKARRKPAPKMRTVKKSISKAARA